MRVEKINTVNNYAIKALDKNNAYLGNKINSQVNDTVNFTGKNQNADEKKPSIFQKIKNVFIKEKSPEEQKSDEIKYYLGDINGLIKEFKGEGKAFHSMLNNMLVIGKENNYKGYLPISGLDEKLTFGNVDEETGLPESATLINVAQGFKPSKSFDIIDGTNIYTAHDYSVEDVDITLDFFGKKVIHYLETDKKTGISTELVPSKEGFTYFEGILGPEGEPLDTNIDIDFKYDENQISTYKEKNKQGELDTYIFNKKTDMWEKQPK